MKNPLICKHCGNIVIKLIDGGVNLVCCGEEMQELVPQTADQTNEKHVPVIEIDGNTCKVTVGSTLHPMQEAHFINFIMIETNKGMQKKDLKPDQEPVAVFKLEDDEEVLAAYEYCNLHGYWKYEVK